MCKPGQKHFVLVLFMTRIYGTCSLFFITFPSEPGRPEMILPCNATVARDAKFVEIVAERTENATCYCIVHANDTGTINTKHYDYSTQPRLPQEISISNIYDQSLKTMGIQFDSSTQYPQITIMNFNETITVSFYSGNDRLRLTPAQNRLIIHCNPDGYLDLTRSTTTQQSHEEDDRSSVSPTQPNTPAPQSTPRSQPTPMSGLTEPMPTELHMASMDTDNDMLSIIIGASAGGAVLLLLIAAIIITLLTLRRKNIGPFKKGNTDTTISRFVPASTDYVSYMNVGSGNEQVENDGIEYAQVDIAKLAPRPQPTGEQAEPEPEVEDEKAITYADLDLMQSNQNPDADQESENAQTTGYGEDNGAVDEHVDVSQLYAQPMKPKKPPKPSLALVASEESPSKEIDLSELYAKPVKKKK